MDPKLTWKLASNAKAEGGWASPAATKKLFFIWVQKTLLLNVSVKNTQ
jgi:hypothetical protein